MYLTRFLPAISRSKQPARSLKKRISKDAVFLMQNRKRVPVTRTSGREPTARSWGHWIFLSRKRSFQHKFRSFFSFSEAALFQKPGENMCFREKKVQLLRSCVFDFSELGVLLLKLCPAPVPSSASSLFSPPSKFILVHPSTIC